MGTIYLIDPFFLRKLKKLNIYKNKKHPKKIETFIKENFIKCQTWLWTLLKKKKNDCEKN